MCNGRRHVRLCPACANEKKQCTSCVSAMILTVIIDAAIWWTQFDHVIDMDGYAPVWWGTVPMNVGLFIPLHFRSQERKVHRWNFRSCVTFVLWNIRSSELLLLWNFRFSGANVPRTFAPGNFHSFRTNRLFQELSLPGTFIPSERTGYSKNFRSMRQKNYLKL